MSIMFPRVWSGTLLAFSVMTETPCSGRRHAHGARHEFGSLRWRLDPKKHVEILRGYGEVRLPVRSQWAVDEVEGIL